MQTNITFRHLESTEAIKSHATEKVEHVVEKYIDRASEAHVVLSLERHLQQADITVHAGSFLLRGCESSNDMYASIDLAVAKIERQLKRYKDKLKNHRALPHHGEGAVAVRHDIVQMDNAGGVSSEPQVIRSKEFSAKTMLLEEAVMQMDLIDNDFLVFTNAGSRELNVLYRRKDGNFGLIEPQTR